MQIAPLNYPHLSHSEIFDSVEVFYKRFYFRAGKIASIVNEMVRSPTMMKRRLREGRGVLPLPARAADGELKQLIVCADDFGLDLAVNEAVETAHRDGILTCASLMVGAPAAADAVARAQQVCRASGRAASRAGRRQADPAAGRGAGPRRRVGRLRRQHGARRLPLLLPAARPPAARRARSTRSSQAFAATGLPLDHANAHKHMHLHPTVAALIMAIGRDYGLTAVRVPAEPCEPLRRSPASARSLLARIGGALPRSLGRAAAPSPAARRLRRQRPSLRPRLDRRHDRDAGPQPAAAPARRASARSISIPRRAGPRRWRAPCRTTATPRNIAGAGQRGGAARRRRCRASRSSPIATSEPIMISGRLDRVPRRPRVRPRRHLPWQRRSSPIRASTSSSPRSPRPGSASSGPASSTSCR